MFERILIKMVMKGGVACIDNLLAGGPQAVRD